MHALCLAAPPGGELKGLYVGSGPSSIISLGGSLVVPPPSTSSFLCIPNYLHHALFAFAATKMHSVIVAVTHVNPNALESRGTLTHSRPNWTWSVGTDAPLERLLVADQPLC